MDNEIIYEPQKQHFRIFLFKEVKFGFWYLTRLLFSLDTEGKEWQQNIFCVCVGCVAFFTIILDVFCIIIFYAVKLIYNCLLSLWRLLIFAAKVVLNNFVGVGLKVVTIIAVALILWLKWHEITDFIRNLF